MIIGTAGHIDHGKSALVTALTGRAMDRLAEERRRGITIDLNFAPLSLGEGITAGVVDVPGHEDFVRTMAAGASGVDLALLVVAGDEGIMPQTVEHLAVLEHLGVPRGIPVVTKADLLDQDWLELVALELGERLARSTVKFDSPVCVSARTGQGMDQLRERIAGHARSAPASHPGDVFRMPVDRTFSVAGVGTVVTGTALTGSIGVGDEVRLLPGGGTGRVRSLEEHGRPVAKSRPRSRTAIGISGIERAEVARGSVVVAAGDAWETTTGLDVRLALDAAAPRRLVQRTRVRVLLGTAETIARVSPRGPIEPGEAGLARLRLEAPAVARGGDRFVLRSFSPVETIGGGIVLDPAPPRRGAAWPAGLESPEPAVRLAALVQRRSRGLASKALPQLLGLPGHAAASLAQRATDLRQVGKVWITEAAMQETAGRALDLLRRYHRQHPADHGMPLETLRRALRATEPVVAAVLDDLVRGRRMRRLEGRAALAGFAPRAAGGAAAVEQIVGLVEAGGLTPPSVAELVRQTGRPDVAAILRLATGDGRIEAVEPERYYARGALDRFLLALRAGEPGRPVVPADLRARLGISRKYLIPLLEWADSKGVTLWDGDVRRVRVAHPA